MWERASSSTGDGCGDRQFRGAPSLLVGIESLFYYYYLFKKWLISRHVQGEVTIKTLWFIINSKRQVKKNWWHTTQSCIWRGNLSLEDNTFPCVISTERRDGPRGVSVHVPVSCVCSWALFNREGVSTVRRRLPKGGAWVNRLLPPATPKLSCLAVSRHQ